jgi:hypothetical protein
MSSLRPIAYTIQRDDFRLDIALAEINKLLLHEETIPNEIESLTIDIMESGYLRNPVIVDRDSLIVLDGMHRVTALRNLNSRYIPVCLIDYNNSKVKIDRWCRVYPSDLKLSAILEGAKKLGMIFESKKSKTVTTDETEIQLLLPDEDHVIIAHAHDVVKAFKIVAKLELWLNKRGVYAEYQTEQDARDRLRKNEIGLILCPPVISKNQVMEVVKKGDLFTFKATRHIIPARPMLVKASLELLNSELNLREVNKLFSQILSTKILRKISPGGLWKGRRYDEDIYVFDDP